jgi:hypothetical protein
VNLRQKIVFSSDRVICALIVVLVLGSALGFGGAVWWFRPVMAAATFLLVAIKLTQNLAAGRMAILKSPLSLLGLLALGLGVLQLAPLPAGLASRLSPAAHEAYSLGSLPRLVHMDDPEASLPEASQIRSPASLDRSATLRWLVEAAACLGIFWSVSHFTDRLGRLYLVWGLVVAAFLLNAALGIVQITNRSEGLYGIFVPGSGPSWAPSLNDLLETPTTTALRNLADPSISGADTGVTTSRAVLIPTTPFLFGTMMGGSGAFLALGALALPLALAIVLHLLSPRGSRESLSDRLGHSSQGSLVLLLVVLMLLGSFLIGLVAGPWYCLPVVLGLATVGLPALILPGSRWPALCLVVLLFAGLGLGVVLEGSWPVLLGGQPPVGPPDLDSARVLWSESLEMIREFPLVGAGLGSFAAIHPYFKDRDMSSTTAMSSLLQWGVESGATGLGILALGVLWCLIRLPSVLKRVNLSDRSLAHGLIGAALSFSLLAAVHWTIELSAVAISASALGGTWNRWLAGGTDLFVERG